MKTPAFYLVNGITMYRLLAAPVLIVLVFLDCYQLFSWMLAVSFFTDLADGFLARRLKVSSAAGARLDSIADELTVLAALTGLLVFKWPFVVEQKLILCLLLFLFLLQNAMALVRYRRISSFHTYLAKISAVLEGCFLILVFLLPQPLYPLFYLMAIFTTAELIEEIILVCLLPRWETDVKGLYWVWQRRSLTKKA